MGFVTHDQDEEWKRWHNVTFSVSLSGSRESVYPRGLFQLDQQLPLDIESCCVIFLCLITNISRLPLNDNNGTKHFHAKKAQFTIGKQISVGKFASVGRGRRNTERRRHRPRHN